MYSIPSNISTNLSRFPSLSNTLSKAISEIAALKSVSGLFVTGSIAIGNVDNYSDIDLLIITPDEELQAVWNNRKLIAAKVDPIIFTIDLIEIMPTTCIFYFENGIKLHLTFESEIHLQFEPEYITSIPIFYKNEKIEDWYKKCNKQIFLHNLQISSG